MRTDTPDMSMGAVPAPGTTEAVELGCICRFIGHGAATQEREPAGIYVDADPNCPVHGANWQAAARD